MSDDTPIGDRPAFPRPPATVKTWEEHTGEADEATHPGFSGMTLRQYYAGQAMKGFCANSAPDIAEWSLDKTADMAVSQAEALIKRLEQS